MDNINQKMGKIAECDKLFLELNDTQPSQANISKFVEIMNYGLPYLDLMEYQLEFGSHIPLGFSTLNGREYFFYLKYILEENMVLLNTLDLNKVEKSNLALDFQMLEKTSQANLLMQNGIARIALFLINDNPLVSERVDFMNLVAYFHEHRVFWNFLMEFVESDDKSEIEIE